MNADQVIFHSVFPLWLVTLVAIALAMFFIWKEVQRKQRYLALRIIAQLIIIISVAALIVRPSIKKEKTIGSALILTKNYNRKTADSLIEKQRLRVLQAFDAAAYPKAQKITSWHALHEDAKDIRYVLGEGVPTSALEEYDLHFDYIKNELPEGIVRINSSSLKKDQINFIKGEVNSKQDAILKLAGPAGVEDSIVLKGTGINSFSLHTHPKQAGKFVYQLNLVAEGKTIESNNLPVEVQEEKKLNILFIQQFPSFETRYLKNYLSDKGHSITLRYQVSKNVYRYEYANRDKQLLPQLTATILESLDLLIITPEALDELSSTEKNAIAVATNNGLGITLLISKPLKNMQQFFPYSLTPVVTDTATINSVQWKSKLTLSATPLRVAPTSSLHALFSDANKQLLSGYYYKGAGVISFQLLNETFHLELKGRASEYASIWAPLLEHTARKQHDPFRIHITSPFPYSINEPVHFEITAGADAPLLNYDSIRIPLKENVSINQLWHGTTWADQTGWQQFTLQDSSQFHFYVSDKKEWNALRLSNQMQQNHLRKAEGSSSTSIIAEYEPLSPLLFFLLFVIASGTLWLLAKL